MKEGFGSKEEKKNLMKMGFLIDSFDNIEFQIDECIAFFLGSGKNIDYFVENVCLEMPFRMKLKIFRKLLKNEEIKKVSKLTKDDLIFIQKFSELRNIIAHSCYLERDGDWSANAFSGKKSFNLENEEEIIKINKLSIKIGGKILSIQKEWWNKKEKIPKFKPRNKDEYFDLNFSTKNI